GAVRTGRLGDDDPCDAALLGAARERNPRHVRSSSLGTRGPPRVSGKTATFGLHVTRCRRNMQSSGCASCGQIGGIMSTITADRIEKQILLRHPRSKVWRALTDSREFGSWFGALFKEPFEVGARVSGRVTHKGYEHMTMDIEIDRMEHERLFSWRWI